jgi:RNA polymerase sigma factor (sigma-70 family)
LRTIAKKYARAGLEQEDLVSIGSIGLIKAVSSFRPEAGRLTAYAFPVRRKRDPDGAAEQ